MGVERECGFFKTTQPCGFWGAKGFGNPEIQGPQPRALRRPPRSCRNTALNWALLLEPTLTGVCLSKPESARRFIASTSFSSIGSVCPSRNLTTQPSRVHLIKVRHTIGREFAYDPRWQNTIKAFFVAQHGFIERVAWVNFVFVKKMLPYGWSIRRQLRGTFRTPNPT